METELPESIERTIAATGVPGASAALVAKGEVSWVGGFGLCLEHGDDPVTADTIFAVASLGLGWGLAGDVFWHWGDVGDFECVAVGSRRERRGLVCLTNGEHGLDACAEILDAVLGARFAYPIRAVLERGW